MNFKRFRFALIAYVLFDVLLGGFCGGLFPLAPMAAAQTNALKNQNALYGNWAVHSTTTIASGAATIVPDACYTNATQPTAALGLPGATTVATHQFFPFATNVPVTIVDGANTETVTPSTVVSPTAAVGPALSPYFCSFTATFSNAHNAGVTIVSGDAGIAEAANDNGSAYGLANGVIFLSGKCTGTAGSAITAGLSGWDPTQVLACSTAFAPTTGAGTAIPRAGLLKSLSVTTTHVGTNASSGVVTVYQNGVATSLTCTIGTGATCSDTTHSVVIAAGDVLAIGFTSQTSDVLAGLTASALVY